MWDEETRQYLNLAWHRLNGKVLYFNPITCCCHMGPALSTGLFGVLYTFRLVGWSDTVEGLHALKKQAIIATLSNGNMRLLVDMVRRVFFPAYILKFKYP